MASAKEHYDSFLGRHYTWMCGDFGEKMRENRELLGSLGVAAAPGMRALDLGCGSGFQSVALAEMGFAVVSVDVCGGLLAELESRRGDLPIEPVCAGLLEFLEGDARGAAGRAGVVVCMGDTLAHLESHEQVRRLLAGVYDRLEEGGRFIVSFRDQSGEPAGSCRVIPLRSDFGRILTAFLQFGDEKITVCDLLHEKGEQGWRLSSSCYEKVRLERKWVVSQLRECGFVVESEREAQRFTVVAASRPRKAGAGATLPE